MPRTDSFLLLSGDYAQRLDVLAARFEAAAEKQEKASSSRRLTDDSELLQVQAEYQALKAEAEDAGTRIELESPGRKVWRAIKAKHPPRTESDEGVDKDTAQGDRIAGVNVDSVEDDLAHAALVEPPEYACSHDQRQPESPCAPDNPCGNRRAYDTWVDDDLSEGEFQMILLRAWRLVNESRVDPKSLPALPTPSGGASAK